MLKNLLQSIRITSDFEEDPVLKQSATPKLELIAHGGVSGGTREHDSRPVCVGSSVVDYPTSKAEHAAGYEHISSG